MPPPPCLADLREQQLIVDLVVDGIDGRRIDDEQGRGLVAVEEPGIGLRELLQIAALDVLLVADPPLRDAIDQHVHGRLQVHHEIGFRRIDHHPLVHPFIEGVFRIVERHPREQPVLVEQIVRDAHGAEQVFLTHFLQLPGALEQEEQLRLKRRRARVLVEALQERILIGLLQDELPAQRLRQAARETGLPYADRSFDHDEFLRNCAQLGTLLI